MIKLGQLIARLLGQFYGFGPFSKSPTYAPITIPGAVCIHHKYDKEKRLRI